VDDSEIPWQDDPALFGLPALELVERSWQTGRDTGLRCGGWKTNVIVSSAEIARRYARMDRQYGDRPGRAHWLAFARARREIGAIMDRIPPP
jgi:hypothetical protein